MSSSAKKRKNTHTQHSVSDFHSNSFRSWIQIFHEYSDSVSTADSESDWFLGLFGNVYCATWGRYRWWTENLNSLFFCSFSHSFWQNSHFLHNQFPSLSFFLLFNHRKGSTEIYWCYKKGSGIINRSPNYLDLVDPLAIFYLIMYIYLSSKTLFSILSVIMTTK